MSDDKLAIRIHVLRYPYRHLMSASDFRELIFRLANSAADQLSTDAYRRRCLGVCILDPTAPSWLPSDKAVMALVTIGDNANDYLVNGVAKAVEHRDYGVDCGELVYVTPHRLATGSFLYGYSVNVDGTIVGASALVEFEDRRFATILATEFNFAIQMAHKAWREAQPEGQKWASRKNLPRDVFVDIARQLLGDYYHYGQPQPSSQS